MLFTVGDSPADALEIAQAAYDPSAEYASMSAKLYTPSGELARDLGTSPFVDGVAEFTWGNAFLEEGVHALRLVLTNGTARRNVPALPVVVEPVMSPWHTVSSIRTMWSDAATVSDVDLWELLQVARDACLVYAPLSGTDVPVRYRQAQALQAREVRNFAKKNPASGDLGEGLFATAVYPLDRVIKQVLRPQSAVGKIVRG